MRRFIFLELYNLLCKKLVFNSSIIFSESKKQKTTDPDFHKFLKAEIKKSSKRKTPRTDISNLLDTKRTKENPAIQSFNEADCSQESSFSISNVKTLDISCNSANLSSLSTRSAKRTTNSYLLNRYKKQAKTSPDAENCTFSPVKTKNESFQKSYLKLRKRSQIIDANFNETATEKKEDAVKNDDAWLKDIESRFKQKSSTVLSPLFAPRSKTEIEYREAMSKKLHT